MSVSLTCWRSWYKCGPWEPSHSSREGRGCHTAKTIALLEKKQPLENLVSCSLVCIKILLLKENPVLEDSTPLASTTCWMLRLQLCRSSQQFLFKANFSPCTSLSQPPYPLTFLHFDQHSYIRQTFTTCTSLSQPPYPLTSLHFEQHSNWPANVSPKLHLFHCSQPSSHILCAHAHSPTCGFRFMHVHSLWRS